MNVLKTIKQLWREMKCWHRYVFKRRLPSDVLEQRCLRCGAERFIHGRSTLPGASERRLGTFQGIT